MSDDTNDAQDVAAGAADGEEQTDAAPATEEQTAE